MEEKKNHFRVPVSDTYRKKSPFVQLLDHMNKVRECTDLLYDGLIKYYSINLILMWCYMLIDFKVRAVKAIPSHGNIRKAAIVNVQGASKTTASVTRYDDNVLLTFSRRKSNYGLLALLVLLKFK